jgi:hypothetical protein
VVVSSPFEGVLVDDGRKILRDGEIGPWTPEFAEGLLRAIRILRRAGKEVIIIGSPPQAGFDVARCHIQVSEGLMRLGTRDCRVRVATLEETYRKVAQALPSIARATGSRLLMPADVLCEKGTCTTKIGDKLLYRDKGHLTEYGSIYVVSRMGLNPLLRRLMGQAAPRREFGPSL